MVWVLIMHFDKIGCDLDINASALIFYINIIEMIYNLFTRCNKNHFRLKFLLIMLIIKNKNFFSKYSVFKFECIFCVIGISKLNGTLRRRLRSTWRRRSGGAPPLRSPSRQTSATVGSTSSNTWRAFSRYVHSLSMSLSIKLTYLCVFHQSTTCCSQLNIIWYSSALTRLFQ